MPSKNEKLEVENITKKSTKSPRKKTVKKAVAAKLEEKPIANNIDTSILQEILDVLKSIDVNISDIKIAISESEIIYDDKEEAEEEIKVETVKSDRIQNTFKMLSEITS